MPAPTREEFSRARRAAVIQIVVLLVLGMLTRVYADSLGSVTAPIRILLICAAIGQLGFWKLAFSPYEEVARAIEEAEANAPQGPPEPPPTSREVVRRWSWITKALIVVTFGSIGLLFMVVGVGAGIWWAALMGLALLAIPGALIWVCWPRGRS